MKNSDALRILKPYLDDNSPSDLSWSANPDCDFWFSGNKLANQLFHVFATRSDGSLIAVWKKDGLDFELCPVVLLGGEGELAVLGDNVAHAVALMAKLGSMSFMVFIKTTENEKDAISVSSDEEEASLLEPDEEFCQWVQANLQTESPRNLSLALSKNIARHPGLIARCMSMLG